MYNTLPTLRNEKEQQQIKFHEKLSGKLVFSWVTKNLKMLYLTCPTGQVLKKQGYTTEMLSTSVFIVNKDSSSKHSPCVFKSNPRMALAEQICSSQTPPI